MTETTLTATTFATTILEMRFGDVMEVVDAINAANGKRKSIDGVTLLAAANLILNGKVGADPAKGVTLIAPKKQPA